MVVATFCEKSKRQILRRTEEDERGSVTFLQVIDRVDPLPIGFTEYPNFKSNVYYLLAHTGTRIGFVCKFAINELQRVSPANFEALFTVNNERHTIQFIPDSFETRNELLEGVSLDMFKHSNIEDVKKWRNEKYAVWAEQMDRPYVLVERSMSGVLGIITYGVHCNGYTFDPVSHEIKFWIPRRSRDKPTWPSLLDNVIAGGIGYPYGVYETLLKEALEEANLGSSVIEPNVTASGVVSYLTYRATTDIERDDFKDEKSFIVGEVEYIYDLKLDSGVVPEPNDGEVDSFNLLSLQEVVDALFRGEFRPNCGLVMVDFLVRHGYITAENEPNYLEIVNRIHRTLPFPTRR